MRQFKAKLRRIGNSLGVIIPKDVITLKAGDVITLGIVDDDVITLEDKPIKESKSVITPTYCDKKHKNRLVYAKSCGCYPLMD
jgi:antitoxin component of MazEF toxin-antitoxin module